MPIFEYKCSKCNKVFEELVTGNQEKSIPCPSCGSVETEKRMSVIGGIAMGKSASDSPCRSNCAHASSCAAASSGSCHCPG